MRWRCDDGCWRWRVGVDDGVTLAVTFRDFQNSNVSFTVRFTCLDYLTFLPIDTYKD